MIGKKSVIERIEILAGGSIQVRFAKLIVDGDKIVGCPQWHRSVLDPGTELEPLLIAVNNHLEQMAEARCGEQLTFFSNITPQTLRQTVGLIHTPEVIQKFKDDQARARASLTPAPQIPA